MTAAQSLLPIKRIAAGALLLAAALVLARLPTLWIAAALAAAAGAIALLRAPWMIWAALAAALPFAAARKVAGPLSLLDLMLAAAVALWLVDGVRRRRFHALDGPALTLRRSGPALAAALYAGALALSTLAAVDLGQAAAEVVKWVEFCAVLLILPAMVAPGRVQWVVAAALAGASAQAALGLYQFYFAIGPEWFAIGRFMRASGSFAQPNPFGGYLGIMLPVAASVALWGLGKRERGTGNRERMAATSVAPANPSHPRAVDPRSPFPVPFLFWPAAAVLIAAGLVASWSRGAWLGAAAGLAVVVALRSRTAALVAALGATLLVAAALLGSITPQIVPAPLRARLADLPSYFGAGDLLAQEVTDENFAVVERVAHWAAAQRMFERSPWIGVGAGNYATIYPQVRLPRWEEPLGHAHNLYLNTLAESGLVGMAAFVALWVTVGVCVVGALRHARRIGDGFAAALAIGVLGVLAHLAVHSLVDNLFVQGMYVQVAIWIALVQSSRFDAQG